MLKGLFTLICIFVLGFFLIRVASPDAYAVLQQRARLAIEEAGAIFNSVSSKEKGSASTEVVLGDRTIPAGFETKAIIDATNAQRSKKGLPPLKENSKLDTSARLKVQDMIDEGYFEHTSPEGITVSDLGDKVGYSYIVMGENLALGNFSSAAELLDAWMNSPGHRANILNANYEEMGAAAFVGTYQGRTEIFAVQHFGTPKIVCPLIEENLKDQISALADTLELQQKGIETTRTKILNEPENSPTYEADIATFNKTVDGYNKLIALQKQKIADYNKQVVAFNKCLSQFQTK
jgi:uncharacterized protein YkwD